MPIGVGSPLPLTISPVLCSVTSGSDTIAGGVSLYREVPEAVLADLANFDITPERGFLPKHDPLKFLPRQFVAWDQLGAKLPELMLGADRMLDPASRRLRNAVEGLKPLDISGLQKEAELERAMRLLSYFGHAYVWADPADPAHEIPATIAVPWYEVSQRLGRHPVLSYPAYALHNWKLLDPDKPITLENITTLSTFLGDYDDRWFIMVHVAIEAQAGWAMAAISAAQDAAERGDLSALESELRHLDSAQQKMMRLLERMPEHCAPYIYFTRVRPFIHGWGGEGGGTPAICRRPHL